MVFRGSLISIFSGYYFIYSRYIKKFGINLATSCDYRIIETKYFLQNDPAWSSDTIGKTNYTMAGAGCLITCVAVSLTDLGIEINPKELNKMLAEIDGYINGELIWYKINTIFPSVKYDYKRIFSSKTIENDLRSKRLPIVTVRFNGSGIMHWVVIVGAIGGDFIIFDPLNRDGKPILLKKHGKVYAYRILSIDR
jgi:hypothetical protein